MDFTSELVLNKSYNHVVNPYGSIPLEMEFMSFVKWHS